MTKPIAPISGLLLAILFATVCSTEATAATALPMEPVRDRSEAGAIDDDDEIVETLRKIRAATERAESSRELIEALRPFLRSDPEHRFACHTAYGTLVEHFRKRDLAPLRRAFAAEKSVDFRLWLAAVADYSGDPALFARLAAQVPTMPDPLDRARAAIAVAFKTGAASVVPALIEALDRSDKLLGHTTVDLAAEYALLVVTNHYARPDHPATLWNYQCFVMPPPVDPYPAPSDFKGPLSAATKKKLQRYWREWWRANRLRPQIDWIRDGIDRDVKLQVSARLGETAQSALETRLRLFVRNYGKRNLQAEWPAERTRYKVPERSAR